MNVEKVLDKMARQLIEARREPRSTDIPIFYDITLQKTFIYATTSTDCHVIVKPQLSTGFCSNPINGSHRSVGSTNDLQATAA